MRNRNLAILAAIAAAVVGGLAVYLRAPPKQQATYFVFGSTTTVELRGADDSNGRAALDAIGQLLQRNQREWHPWEISDLMRLNAALARGESYRVPNGLAELIRRAQRAFVDSDHLFNPAVGALIGLWGFHTSEFPLVTPPPMRPTIDSLLAANPRMDDIVVDVDGTVSSRNRAVELDLNGLAEGFAAEQISQLLAQRGIGNSLINLGGDVLARGDAGGRPWRVAISTPQHNVLATAELTGHEALFSSGDYNKFREIEGQRWGHVLDPRNGEPTHGVAAASVIHADAIVADVAATTLMIAGSKDFVRIAQGLGIRCALLMTEDGVLWITPAMRARLRFEVTPPRIEIADVPGSTCAGP
ncbi:MAG: FAD:protein FMN transferase [Tahibacter sp.]